MLKPSSTKNVCSRVLLYCMIQRKIHPVKEAVISVDRNHTLVDEPVKLRITGLQARQNITLYASIRLPNSALFESTSQYVSNELGIVDLSRDESRGGSFTGIDEMGWMNFMAPSAINKQMHERFGIKDPKHPFTVEFRVIDRLLDTINGEFTKRLLDFPAKLSITRTYIASGVTEVPVREGRIRGTLYLPAGEGLFPGVISMSGGYPGALNHKGALLASHGFACIALKYFGDDDLQEEFFPADLDYTEEAALFLKNHPKVDGRNGIGIVANCYGATIGLALASMAPKGLIKSVVSVNGWSFPFGTFRYRGREFLAPESLTITPIQRDNDIIVDCPFRWNINEKQGVSEGFDFPFYKRRDIAYMFVVGSDDGYYDSPTLSPFTKKLLQTSSHPNFEYIYYKGAGHLLEHRYHPLNRIVYTFKQYHDCGGDPQAHAKAQEHSWPKILEFTRKNLCGIKPKF